MAEAVTMIEYGSNKNKDKIKRDEEELEALVKSRQPEEEEESDEDNADPNEEDQNISDEERTFKKRYGDLKRHAAEERRKLEKRIEELEKTSKGTVEEMPTTDEDLDQWKKDHPKVYARVEAIARKMADGMLSKYDDRFKRIEEAEQETKREQALNAIRKAHDDFDDIVADDKFHDWVEEQPEWVQDSFYKNQEDAKSVIRLMDVYKLEHGMSVKQRKERDKKALEQPTSSRTRPDDGASAQGKTFKESQIKKMTDRQFEENLEEINKAKREGRIIYDLSS